MSENVTVIVTWTIKPDLTKAFAEFLGGMFPVTRQHKGFQTIRLLQGDTDRNQFVLLEEWDSVQDFHDYAKFREEAGDTEKLLAMTASYPQMSVWTLNPLAAAQA